MKTISSILKVIIIIMIIMTFLSWVVLPGAQLAYWRNFLSFLGITTLLVGGPLFLGSVILGWKDGRSAGLSLTLLGILAYLVVIIVQ